MTPASSFIRFLRELSNKKYTYGCCMLYFQFPEMEQIQSRISKEDIYTEDGFGLEDEPHITLLYGFHEEVTVGEIEKIISNFSFYPIRVHNASLFQNGTYDVLKFEAKEPSLHRCNERLRDLPHTTSYPIYNPHLTIGYLRPGTGREYVDKFKNLSYLIAPEYGMFSSSTGEKLKFEIKNRQ